MIGIDPKLNDEQLQELIMKPYNDMMTKVGMLNVDPPYLAEYNKKQKCITITDFNGTDDIVISSKIKRLMFSHSALWTFGETVDSSLSTSAKNNIRHIIIKGDTEILNGPHLIITYILKQKLVINSDKTFNDIISKAVKQIDTENDTTQIIKYACNLCRAIHNRYNVNSLMNIYNELQDILYRAQRDLGYDNRLFVESMKVLFKEINKLGIEV